MLETESQSSAQALLTSEPGLQPQGSAISIFTGYWGELQRWPSQIAGRVALRYVPLFCRFGKWQRCPIDAYVGFGLAVGRGRKKNVVGTHFLVSSHGVHSADAAFFRLGLSSEVVSCLWLSRCLGTTGHGPHFYSLAPTQTGSDKMFIVLA